jgi:hypothetical protein
MNPVGSPSTSLRPSRTSAALHQANGHVHAALAPVRVHPADNILVLTAQENQPFRLPRHVGVEKDKIGAVGFEEVADDAVSRVVNVTIALEDQEGGLNPRFR